MKQALLILSVLGMGIAQTSGAAITISQTNNTITNTSVASNYGSSKTSIAPAVVLMFLVMTKSVKLLAT